MREDIETVIDRLLDFVRTNGRVRLQDAAGALALSGPQTEKIALLLEESHLLEVEYSIGGIFLSAVKPTDDAGSLGETGKPARPAEENAATDEMARLEREVLTSENLLKFFERDLARRIVLVDSMLDDLEKRRTYSPKELERAQREAELARAQLESFGVEIGKLSAREKQLAARVTHFAQRLAKLTPSKMDSTDTSDARAANPLVLFLSRIRRTLLELVNAIRARLMRRGGHAPRPEKGESEIARPVQGNTPASPKRMLPAMTLIASARTRHRHAQASPRLTRNPGRKRRGNRKVKRH